MPMLFGHVHEKPFNFDKPAHFQKLLNDFRPERNKTLHDENRLLEAYLLRDEVEHLASNLYALLFALGGMFQGRANFFREDTSSWRDG